MCGRRGAGFRDFYEDELLRQRRREVTWDRDRLAVVVDLVAGTFFLYGCCCCEEEEEVPEAHDDGAARNSQCLSLYAFACARLVQGSIAAIVSERVPLQHSKKFGRAKLWC